MDPSQPNLSTDAYDSGWGAWPEDSDELLYKGNLIYLSFARHLAEEDEAAWAKAA